MAAVHPKPAVSRCFEFSRLQEQLLALAYEHLLPIIRPATQRGRALVPGGPGARQGCQPSLQEEEACENR
jgi:hypothetical protein